MYSLGSIQFVVLWKGFLFTFLFKEYKSYNGYVKLCLVVVAILNFSSASIYQFGRKPAKKILCQLCSKKVQSNPRRFFAYCPTLKIVLQWWRLAIWNYRSLQKPSRL